MTVYDVKNHEPSILPDGKWTMIWNDEFDGNELDTSKWDFRLNMMGSRHETWQDDGVFLDGNSNCVFKIYEKNGHVCSSQLQTGYNYMDEPIDENAYKYGKNVWPIGKLKKSKFLHAKGYYECRCKLQNMPGWWSAFWLQSPCIGCRAETEFAGVECDIMESFSPGHIIPHTNHFDGYGIDHKRAKAGGDCDISLGEFHRFGVLWDDDGYTFYVDGIEDGHIDGPVSLVPQFILISTEVEGYRGGSYQGTDEAYAAAKAGDTFVVDYVRVFDKI